MLSVATKILKMPANRLSAPGIGLSAAEERRTLLVEYTKMQTPSAAIPRLTTMASKPICRTKLFNSAMPMVAKNMPAIKPRGAEKLRPEIIT